ncbi:MAG: acid phosphatase, partial [Desulfuromusa sp.]|nr:acid phosphatase [Desulfuromusa sp.]
MMKYIQNNLFYKTLFIFMSIALMAGCASIEKLSNPEPVPEIRPGLLQGYLPTDALPDSLSLLPPPPAAGSTSLTLDEDVSQKSIALRDSPRWKLAAEDANLMFPQTAGTFSCALNAPITEQNTPHLYMLMRRTLTDAGLSTY